MESDWLTDELMQRASRLIQDIEAFPSQGTVYVVSRALLAAEKRGREEAAILAREYPLTDIFEEHSNRAVAFNTSQNIADIIQGKLVVKITLEGEAQSEVAAIRSGQ